MTEWNLPETYDFKERTVRYGVKGEGPPVVVVHGTPWSSFNLRHIIKALSQSFTYTIMILSATASLIKHRVMFLWAFS